MKKLIFIPIILLILSSCSNNDDVKNINTKPADVSPTPTAEEQSLSGISGSFGSDNTLFNDNNTTLEAETPLEISNENIYSDILTDFSYNATDITDGIFPNNKINLLEEFVDNDGKKIGKFFIQKVIASFYYYFYKNSAEGLVDRDVIIFDKDTTSSNSFLQNFLKANPIYSKSNSLNNETIDKVYSLYLNIENKDNLPKYNSEDVNQIILNIFERSLNRKNFNLSGDIKTIFYIFELSNAANKTVCTVLLPEILPIYSIDINYGSQYTEYYNSNKSDLVLANLPNLSTPIGKIQAFTSLYTECISL
jgi:hypothetical protein